MTTRFKAIQNLPFGIKENDILTFDGTYCTDTNGEIILLNPSREKEFFKAIKDQKFKAGDFVCIKNHDVKSKKNYLAIGKPYEIIRYLSGTSNYVILRTPQGDVEIHDVNLHICTPYWFLNSSGKISTAIHGKEPNADTFRVLTNNYFGSYKDAEISLKNILSRQ